MLLGEILSSLDRIAPFSLALSWDNSGLQVGDLHQKIERLYLALEATHEVIDRAQGKGAQLIVTHHPLIFTPLKAIVKGGYPGTLIYRLIESDMALIAMHTNWDAAPEGLSHALAQKVGLRDQEFLEPLSPSGEGGIGRVGILPQATTPETLAHRLMEELPAPWARVVGDPYKKVQRVAVCPGSGGDLWPKAQALGAQLLVTGDVKHHQAREAQETGMILLDLGHFATESWGMRLLKEKIEKEVPQMKVEVDTALRDPFTIYTKGGIG